MQDTPDLSKIVSLIMENPSLLEQISALAKGADKTDATSTPEPTPDQDTYEAPSMTQKAEPTVAQPTVQSSTPDPQKERRNKLLYAMKPYLSEGRRGAIDTMISIADMLHMMRGK